MDSVWLILLKLQPAFGKSPSHLTQLKCTWDCFQMWWIVKQQLLDFLLGVRPYLRIIELKYKVLLMNHRFFLAWGKSSCYSIYIIYTYFSCGFGISVDGCQISFDFRPFHLEEDLAERLLWYLYPGVRIQTMGHLPDHQRAFVFKASCKKLGVCVFAHHVVPRHAFLLVKNSPSSLWKQSWR